MWLITTGRPHEVIDGYGLTRAEGWPPGVWIRPWLDAMAIVVLSELPRERDTLLLRLLGRGWVLEQAIADLRALPEDAEEREVAYPPLVALRFKCSKILTPTRKRERFSWQRRISTNSGKSGRRRMAV